MKISFSKVILACLVFQLFSCKKDKDAVYSEENPIEGFYIATGFNQQITNWIDASDDFVTGYRFSAKVNGKINAITLKIPDGEEFVKVNIFDFSSSKLLHSENMVVPNANVNVIKTITPINLEKDKDYIICMYTNDNYYRRKTDMGSITYPITSGNIVFKEFLVDPIFGPDNKPTGGGSTSFNGDLSFVFQQTN